MNILEEIIQKEREHQTYLATINTQAFESFSREELHAFANEMQNIKTHSPTRHALKMAERKKFEEYPQLLSVHHYPELKEIDFLTEEQLIALDENLALSPLHDVIALTSSRVPYIYHERTYEFLLEKGIITRYIHAECPNCHYHVRLSGSFDKKHKEQWLADLKASNEAYEAVGLLKQDGFHFGGYCDSCDEVYGVEDGDLTEDFLENIGFGGFFVLTKERDKRWDNV